MCTLDLLTCSLLCRYVLVLASCWSFFFCSLTSALGRPHHFPNPVSYASCTTVFTPSPPPPPPSPSLSRLPPPPPRPSPFRLLGREIMRVGMTVQNARMKTRTDFNCRRQILKNSRSGLICRTNRSREAQELLRCQVRQTCFDTHCESVEVPEQSAER